METESVVEKPKKPHPFEITVNNKPVVVQEHKMKGIEIKQAAINAGVNIRIDFLLFLVREHHPQKRIDDDESVTLKEHDEFDCVGNDDNS